MIPQKSDSVGIPPSGFCPIFVPSVFSDIPPGFRLPVLSRTHKLNGGMKLIRILAKITDLIFFVKSECDKNLPNYFNEIFWSLSKNLKSKFVNFKQ